MKSVRLHEEKVERYIGTEYQARRLLGPMERNRFPQVHISLLGVIPKSEPGKWRLIVHLLSPCGNSIKLMMALIRSGTPFHIYH